MKIVRHKITGNLMTLYFDKLEITYAGLEELHEDPEFIGIAEKNRATSSALEYPDDPLSIFEAPKAKLFKRRSGVYHSFGEQVFGCDADNNCILTNTTRSGPSREVFTLLTGQDLKSLWTAYLDVYLREKSAQREV